jgi:phosphatidate cytidylyltransferase
MLKKRLIPASILIILIFGLFYLDHYFKFTIGFTVLLCLVAIGGLYEFYKMYENIGIKLPKVFPIIFITTCLLILQPAISKPIYSYEYHSKVIITSVSIISAFTITSVIHYIFNIANFSRIFILIIGFIYIYIPLAVGAFLYDENWFCGPAQGIIIYLVALIKISDSLAYFGGKAFGRHKLAPTISPNKTVEGFIAALVGGTICGYVLVYLMRYDYLSFGMWWKILLANFLIVFFAQMGDLLESMFKRHCQVKDSGSFLGGLGGMLDLVDSILLGIPAFVLTLPLTLDLWVMFPVPS